MLIKRPVLHSAASMSLVELGFDRAGIDDGWQACNSYTVEPSGSSAFHDANGKVNVNQSLFPDLKGLAAYAAAKNVKLGWCECDLSCSCSELALQRHCSDVGMLVLVVYRTQTTTIAFATSLLATFTTRRGRT